MSSYFLDTSAIVKRYAPEVGHQWITTLCDARPKHTLYIAEVALVEVVATFCRMARETPPRMKIGTRDQLITLFQRHLRRDYAIITLTRELLRTGSELCRIAPLRAYDAMQLACALKAQARASALGVPAPIFVCADANLLQVAATQGLTTENPSTHP